MTSTEGKGGNHAGCSRNTFYLSLEVLFIVNIFVSLRIGPSQSDALYLFCSDRSCSNGWGYGNMNIMEYDV